MSLQVSIGNFLSASDSYRIVKKNCPNVKKVGTIFIKCAKINQVKQAFAITRISNFSIHIHYTLSVLCYRFFAFYVVSVAASVNMMSIPPSPMYCLSSFIHSPSPSLTYYLSPLFHTVWPPPSCILSVSLSYALSFYPHLIQCPSPLFRIVCPPLLHTVCHPPLTFCPSPLLHTVYNLIYNIHSPL